MATITDIHAREILDSRGNPTLEVQIILDDGIVAKASVPSGASTGSHEAHELRDGDNARYGGKGVKKAVRNVNTILRKTLLGQSVLDQRVVDHLLISSDKTKNKSNIGANAILGVSLAVARCSAKVKGIPLYRHLRNVFFPERETWNMPLPMMNVLNGGAHANFAVDIQECLIIPKLRTFAECVRAGSEIFHVLGEILKKKKLPTTVGDEGGYAPQLSTNEKSLALITEAIKKAGYKSGKNIFIGLDVAASELYDKKKKQYVLSRDKKKLTSAEMIELYQKWRKKYGLFSLEDGLDEDDWDGWVMLTKKMGKTVNLIGDDLFVTNKERLLEGIAKGTANAILIKPNQIGTLSETVDAIILAQQNRYKIAISHRSGETVDTFISDLSVAAGADFIKTGSLSRSERVEKYNRLMKIEEELTA